MPAEAALALPTLLAPGSEPDALQAISMLLLQRPTPAAGSGQRGSEPSPLAALLAAAERDLQLLYASGSRLAVAAAGSTFAQIEGQPNRSAWTWQHPGYCPHSSLKRILSPSIASHEMLFPPMLLCPTFASVCVV